MIETAEREREGTAKDYEIEKEKKGHSKEPLRKRKRGRQKEKEGKRGSTQRLWGLGLCRGGVWFGKRRNYRKGKDFTSICFTFLHFCLVFFSRC